MSNSVSLNENLNQPKVEKEKVSKKVDTIEDIIQANNTRLLKDKDVCQVERTSISGVKYTNTYVIETWVFVKTSGKSSTFYKMSREIPTVGGKKLTIDLPLSSEQVEYINYYKDDLLKNMQQGSALKRPVRTRFSYGYNDQGKPYVRYQVILADNIVISKFLSPLQTDMLFNSFKNINTAFLVVLDKKADIEENDEEVAYL